MSSWNIRRSSQLMRHVSGHNTGHDYLDFTLYNYTYYDAEEGEVYKGQIYHDRREGIRELIKAILKDVDLEL